MQRSAPLLRRGALLSRGRNEIDLSVMRGLDPRIHHLRKTLSRRWMAGSSPAMTLQSIAVPALRSSVKNAAPPPGHEALASRRLPAAAAAIAGNDSAPAARPVIAGEPAAAAGVRQADRYVDRHHAAAADATRHLASSSRRNPTAGHGEGDAVGRAAISRSGGEHHIPGTVIGSPHGSPRFGGPGRRRNHGENGGGQRPSQGA